MIEDQLAPKRCGHTPGKAVVGREEAFDRIRAAVDARAEGRDILILARTDARHEHGLGEAIERAARFHELGADILFVEAPKTEAEMREVCASLPGPKMANIVEGGETPNLPQEALSDIGYAHRRLPADADVRGDEGDDGGARGAQGRCPARGAADGLRRNPPAHRI